MARMNGYTHKNTKIKKDPMCSITRDGYFSHGHYAVLISDAIKESNPVLFTVEQRDLDTSSLIGDITRYEPAEYEHIIQRQYEGKPYEYLFIRSRENGRSTYINRQYTDTLLTLHPLSIPHILDDRHPIVFMSAGHVTGLIMPVIIEDSPKDEATK